MLILGFIRKKSQLDMINFKFRFSAWMQTIISADPMSQIVDSTSNHLLVFGSWHAV